MCIKNITFESKLLILFNDCFSQTIKIKFNILNDIPSSNSIRDILSILIWP